MERKKSQEQRLAEQEREKALMNSQIKAKMEQDLRRAEKLKEAKVSEESKVRGPAQEHGSKFTYLFSWKI